MLRIPMAGGVSSLNVSAAGAVVLYEAFRQRRAAARSATAGFPKNALPQERDASNPAASKPAKQKGLGS
jgi:23S rRNA (guanosine2251-2'-O)-methyltransferase